MRHVSVKCLVFKMFHHAINVLCIIYKDQNKTSCEIITHQWNFPPEVPTASRRGTRRWRRGGRRRSRRPCSPPSRPWSPTRWSWIGSTGCSGRRTSGRQSPSLGAAEDSATGWVHPFSPWQSWALSVFFYFFNTKKLLFWNFLSS